MCIILFCCRVSSEDADRFQSVQHRVYFLTSVENFCNIFYFECPDVMWLSMRPYMNSEDKSQKILTQKVKPTIAGTMRAVV